MNWKTLQIFQQEIYSLVSRRSFWVATLGVPLVGLLVYLVVGNLNRSQGSEQGANPMGAIVDVMSEEPDLRPHGYVDLSGMLLDGLPDDLEQASDVSLLRFADETSARAALNAGEISTYYVIPLDYLQTGNMLIYGEQFELMDSNDQSYWLEQALNQSLLEGDETTRWRVQEPLGAMNVHNLSGDAKEEARSSTGAGFFVPYAVMMLLYISLMSSSGMLLNSVTKEKENRVMEVLLLSTHPRELLMGKVLGLGIIGLVQVMIWAVTGLVLMRSGGDLINLPDAFQLQPSFLLWTLVFFVLGYLVYASLMAGVGALVPNLREASQATIYVALPLMIPMFLLNALIGDPNSPLSTFMSIFPFTAPTTMLLRMAATNVPLWQVLLAVALLAVTAVLVVRAVAGMFRAQSLLGGGPFKLKVFLKALAGRA